MAVTRFKISSIRDFPAGSRQIPSKTIAKATSRIKVAMQSVIRDNQKKQRKSLEKASKTVLNA